jgi:hypothetical protein
MFFGSTVVIYPTFISRLVSILVFMVVALSIDADNSSLAMSDFTHIVRHTFPSDGSSLHAFIPELLQHLVKHTR